MLPLGFWVIFYFHFGRERKFRICHFISNTIIFWYCIYHSMSQRKRIFRLGDGGLAGRLAFFSSPRVISSGELHAGLNGGFPPPPAQQTEQEATFRKTGLDFTKRYGKGYSSCLQQNSKNKGASGPPRRALQEEGLHMYKFWRLGLNKIITELARCFISCCVSLLEGAFRADFKLFRCSGKDCNQAQRRKGGGYFWSEAQVGQTCGQPWTVLQRLRCQEAG